MPSTDAGQGRPQKCLRREEFCTTPKLSAKESVLVSAKNSRGTNLWGTKGSRITTHNVSK